MTTPALRAECLARVTELHAAGRVTVSPYQVAHHRPGMTLGAAWAGLEALYCAGELDEPRKGEYRVPRVFGAMDQVALDQIALDFTGGVG